MVVIVEISIWLAVLEQSDFGNSASCLQRYIDWLFIKVSLSVVVDG